MKKLLKVELREHRGATDTEGGVYHSEEWNIYFDSLTNKADKPDLEQHMLARLRQEFPEEFQPNLQFLLYGALSQGGSLKHADKTVTVSFTNPHPTLPAA